MRKFIILGGILVSLGAVAFYAFWYMQAQKMQDKVTEGLEQGKQMATMGAARSGPGGPKSFKLNYSAIRKTGFPMEVGVVIDDLDFAMSDEITEMAFSFPTISIRKSLFNMTDYSATLSKEIKMKWGMAGNAQAMTGSYNTAPEITVQLRGDKQPPRLIRYQDSGSSMVLDESGKEVGANDASLVEWKHNQASGKQVDGHVKVAIENLRYDYSFMIDGMSEEFAEMEGLKALLKKYSSAGRVDMDIDVGYDITGDLKSKQMMGPNAPKGAVAFRSFKLNSQIFDMDMTGDITFGDPYMLPKVELQLQLGKLVNLLQYYADYVNAIVEMVPSQMPPGSVPPAFTEFRVGEKHVSAVYWFMRRISDDPEQERDFTYAIRGENGMYTIGGKNMQEVMQLAQNDLIPVFMEDFEAMKSGANNQGGGTAVEQGQDKAVNR